MSKQSPESGPRYRPITTIEQLNKMMHDAEKDMYLKTPNNIEVKPGPTIARDGWRPEAFPDAYIGDTHTRLKNI